MRRVGLWVVAACVGCVAVLVAQATVRALAGNLQGGAAIAYLLALPAVFGFTTAWVVTWLEAISRPAGRSRFGSRAH